jgi:hypothetical protein
VPQRGTLSERIPNSNHVVHVSCSPCALCSIMHLKLPSKFKDKRNSNLEI